MNQQLSMNKCHFCTDILADPISEDPKSFYLQFESNKKAKLIKTMNYSLYVKYSSSQNYHYTKDLNDILASKRTSATVLFRDLVCYDDDSEECLNRIYNSVENVEKFQMLGEYYKFHQDIPRLYMLPAIISLNWFHDHKRRLEYFRIARMIDQENQNNPDLPPKGIVGDSPALVRESENFTENNGDDSSDLIEQRNSKKDKILDEISWLKLEVSGTKDQTVAPRQTQKMNLQLKLQQWKYIQVDDQSQKVSQEKQKQLQESTKSLQKTKTVPSQNNLIQQQIQILHKALQSNSSKTKVTTSLQREEQDSKGWKKNLRLDENILKQQQDQFQQSNRVSQTTSNSKLVTSQKRPSISSIMQIIKSIPPPPVANQSKNNSLKISMETLQQTPRAMQITISHPKSQSNKNKEISRISALLSTHKMTPQGNKSPYSQISIDLQKQTSHLLGKSQQYSQFQGNVTPRNPYLHQSHIASPKTSPKQGQQLQFKQKVQMLELKVLTDLQQLQSKKQQSSKPKKHQTLQLDSLSFKSSDPVSLTQRFVTNEPMDYTTLKMKSIYQRKKCNLYEPHRYSQMQMKNDKQYPSGAQSHREKLTNEVKVPSMQMNTSNEQFKSSQVYYNNAQSNPSLVSTFATQSLSSVQNSINNKNLAEFKALGMSHSKSQSYNKQVNKQFKLATQIQSADVDSQLYKAAMNLAIKIKDPPTKLRYNCTLISNTNREMIIQSARGFHPNALMKLKQQTPLTYRVSNEDQIKQFKSTQSMLKGYKKESKK